MFGIDTIISVGGRIWEFVFGPSPEADEQTKPSSRDAIQRAATSASSYLLDGGTKEEEARRLLIAPIVFPLHINRVSAAELSAKFTQMLLKKTGGSVITPSKDDMEDVSEGQDDIEDWVGLAQEKGTGWFIRGLIEGNEQSCSGAFQLYDASYGDTKGSSFLSASPCNAQMLEQCLSQTVVKLVEGLEPVTPSAASMTGLQSPKEPSQAQYETMQRMLMRSLPPLKKRQDASYEK